MKFLLVQLWRRLQVLSKSIQKQLGKVIKVILQTNDQKIQENQPNVKRENAVEAISVHKRKEIKEKRTKVQQKSKQFQRRASHRVSRRKQLLIKSISSENQKILNSSMLATSKLQVPQSDNQQQKEIPLKQGLEKASFRDCAGRDLSTINIQSQGNQDSEEVSDGNTPLLIFAYGSKEEYQKKHQRHTKFIVKKQKITKNPPPKREKASSFDSLTQRMNNLDLTTKKKLQQSVNQPQNFSDNE